MRRFVIHIKQFSVQTSISRAVPGLCTPLYPERVVDAWYRCIHCIARKSSTLDRRKLSLSWRWMNDGDASFFITSLLWLCNSLLRYVCFAITGKHVGKCCPGKLIWLPRSCVLKAPLSQHYYQRQGRTRFLFYPVSLMLQKSNIYCNLGDRSMESRVGIGITLYRQQRGLAEKKSYFVPWHNKLWWFVVDKEAFN